MTVYVVQAMKGRDYSDAKQYGQLRALLPAEHQITHNSPVLFRDLKKKLAMFDARADFLLLSGDPIAIGIVTTMVFDMTAETVSFLKWDKIDSKYHVVGICL